MPLFRPINLTHGVTLYDGHWPMDRARRQDGLDAFYAEFTRLMVETAGKTDWEAGCHSMWGGRDSASFLEQRGKPGGLQHYSEYRAKLKVERTLVGTSGSSRSMLAWKGDDPVGGVVFYNIKLLGNSQGGVLEFESHFGPFLTPPSLNREFFEHMLKHQVQADDDDGRLVRVQLVSWKHDSVEPANRWLSDSPSSLLWADIDGLDGVFEMVDGKRVRQSTRKSVGRG